MFATAGSWLVDRCGDAWRWLTHDGRWRTYLVLVALLTVVVVLGVTDQKILIWYACFALFGWLVHHERMIERARHRPGDDPRQRTAFATILLGIGVALILVGLANQQIAFFVGVALGVIAGGMLYSEFRRWRGPGHTLGPIMMLVALALLVVAIVVRPVAIFGLLVLAAVFLGELGTERASEDSHEVASTADPTAARPSVNGAIVAGAGLLLLLVGFSLLVAVGTSPTAGLLVLGVLAVFVVLAIMDSDSALIVTLIAIVLAIAIQPPTESPDKAHRAVVDKPYFLVLGDSYISGEGADQFLAGTNTKTPNADHTNECRQSNERVALRARPARRAGRRGPRARSSAVPRLLRRGEREHQRPPAPRRRRRATGPGRARAVPARPGHRARPPTGVRDPRASGATTPGSASSGRAASGRATAPRSRSSS